MKLRLGQTVRASDGVVGEIGDIVIDPMLKTVTHLVVEPHHQHYQARLVPIDLASVVEDHIELSIDTKHLRSLQQIAESEYLPIGGDIELDPEWDVGTENIVSVPMAAAEYGMWAYDDHVTINYDRIPRGDCEIRSASRVTTSDGHDVGTVEGFMADDTHLAGVVVRAARGTRRHYVVVPMHGVAKVHNDAIALGLDQTAFDGLPVADDIMGPDDAPSTLTRIEHNVENAAHALQAKLSLRRGR